MNRNDVAELIVAARIQKGVKWADAPYKGSPPTAVPTDPLIYRFYS